MSDNICPFASLSLKSHMEFESCSCNGNVTLLQRFHSNVNTSSSLYQNSRNNSWTQTFSSGKKRISIDFYGWKSAAFLFLKPSNLCCCSCHEFCHFLYSNRQTHSVRKSSKMSHFQTKRNNYLNFYAKNGQNALSDSFVFGVKIQINPCSLRS